MTLDDFGWQSTWADRFAPYAQEGYTAGRVTLEQKHRYCVLTAECGEIPAVVTGRFSYEARHRLDLPAVGDWAVLRLQVDSAPRATIHAILPRCSRFTRRDPGHGGAQIIAANVDTAFLVVGLDGNYNLRRIERYLTVAWESGADPVVLLTKADLCEDAASRVQDAAGAAPGVPVHAISTFTGCGLDELQPYLLPGRTVALLGSSGVGKSTLLNRLLGREAQRTQAVRDFDDKGRHTTTQRQLFRLPGGALLLDTPGLRELQLWHADDGLSDAFADITALAEDCRFPDCRHLSEPGCRVRDAVAEGTLDAGRLDHYHRMARELRYLASRDDREIEQTIKREHKRLGKLQKAFQQRGKGVASGDGETG